MWTMSSWLVHVSGLPALTSTWPGLNWKSRTVTADCDASGVAALLFGEDHITEIKLNDDRMGMLVMTRDREQFARALGRIALDGHRIESVVPADENVDALYEYLIGGES